jgi:metal-responsive CopG/Arc/MetJ family transcriptional regulator
MRVLSLTEKYNFCYTLIMKTAISIPDPVFQSAEKLARRLGKSRSQLYTQALSSYLEKSNSSSVKDLLDKVYGSTTSHLDPQLQRLQTKVVAKEQW